MVRDEVTFEQSPKRNHAEIGGKVFWAEKMANVKALRQVRRLEQSWECRR